MFDGQHEDGQHQVTAKKSCDGPVISAGEQLSKARKTAQKSLDELAAALCVRRDILSAIENDDHEALPQASFAIGFVRSYARALGLNDNEIVADFRRDIGVDGPPRAPDCEIRAMKQVPAKSVPAWAGPFAGLLGMAFIWISVMSGGETSPVAMQEDKNDVSAILADVKNATGPQQAIDQILDQQQETGEKGSTAIDPELNKPAADLVADDVQQKGFTTFFPQAVASTPDKSAGHGADLALKASRDVWVRLADSENKEIWSGVLYEGDVYRPDVPSNVRLTISDASALELSVAGVVTSLSGQPGEIITDLDIDLSKSR